MSPVIAFVLLFILIVFTIRYLTFERDNMDKKEGDKDYFILNNRDYSNPHFP